MQCDGVLIDDKILVGVDFVGLFKMTYIIISSAAIIIMDTKLFEYFEAIFTYLQKCL